MPAYSIVIPLYNRPNEIDELLQSLTKQTFKDFEVLVVEDGSQVKSEEICQRYAETLDIRYFFKENQGPGLTRNYGCQHALSEFFIFFDSDCIIPSDYLLHLDEARSAGDFDAFGGPDEADESFTPVQKAINYSMTSIFTTGGIRGKKGSVEKFHPRSFNMGISREVFERTGGFAPMRFGEDIDFSIRIVKSGFSATLLTECYVYHKRRTNFRQFYKQVFNSGVARINLFKRHPQSLKLIHFFPAVFTFFLPISLLFCVLLRSVLPVIPYVIYFTTIFLDSLARNKNLYVAGLSKWATLVQLTGYGLGFIKAFWRRLILGKGEFEAFKRNFYK